MGKNIWCTHVRDLTQPEQVLLTVDEVMARRPEPRHFLELRTARLVTEHGSRYLSGVGTALLQYLQVAVLLCRGPLGCLLLIADGTRAIGSFFANTLATLADTTMLLDWHHLKQKCQELSSRICQSKAAKAQMLRRLEWRLWRGDVEGALVVLERQRPEAKSEAKLDELIAYLRARASWMPNYRQRRIARQ